MDKVFISVCGIDVARGLTLIESEEALTFRAMIQQAKKTIVVADASKLGVVNPALVCPLSDIQMLITDTRASDKAFRVHTRVSPVMARNSHARAVIQSRFTVAGEIPSTSEVSSMVRPAKKRSSTIRPCCASRFESSLKAASSATTSTSLCCGRAMASSRVSVIAPPPRLAAPRPRAYSTKIWRMTCAAIPKKWARFRPASLRYASWTNAVLCKV
jgi:hypothetical protein